MDATEQGGEIHPINFNLYAYERDEAHEVKEAADETREAYFEYKEEQQEVQDAIAEAERLENMAWYEKAWEYGSAFVGEATGYYDSVRATTGVDPVTDEELTVAERTKHGVLAATGFIPFVGWAGRAFKGGKAIHSTYKGMKATDSALNAYQTGRTLDTLRKAEYGLYGITSANGLGEYATGRDIFGNELSEEQRERSLNETLAFLGGNATSVGLRKASPTISFAEGNKKIKKGERYGERKISDETYAKLRRASPSSKIQKEVNKDIDNIIGTEDFALPGKIIDKKLHADHIIPLDKIARMEGFDWLDYKQQKQIANFSENFVGLSPTANTSKGSKTYTEWTMYKKEKIPVNPDFRKK